MSALLAMTLPLAACDYAQEGATVVVAAALGFSQSSKSDSPTLLPNQLEISVESRDGVAGVVRIAREGEQLVELSPGLHSLSFAAHERITMEAVASTGNLVSWNGDDCEGSGRNVSCVVTGAAARAMAAVFGPPVSMTLARLGPGQVTLSGAGAGVVQVTNTTDSVTIIVAEGGRITVEAQGIEGSSVFDGWSGGLCQNDVEDVCTVASVDGGQVLVRFGAAFWLEARAFGQAPHTLTVSFDAGRQTRTLSSGPTIDVARASPAILRETLAVGSEVVLSAVAGAGNVVTWEDDCAGAELTQQDGARCVILMTADRSASAVFGVESAITVVLEPQQLLAEDNAPAEQTRRQVLWRPAGGPAYSTLEATTQHAIAVAEGTVLDFVAESGYRSEFVTWGEGAASACGQQAACMLPAIDGLTVLAEFAAASRLALRVVGRGTVTVRVDADLVDTVRAAADSAAADLRVRNGSNVTLSASNGVGTVFALWTDGAGELAACQGDTTATGTVCALAGASTDTAITAQFIEASALLLDVTGGGAAWLAVQPQAYNVAQPSSVSIPAASAGLAEFPARLASSSDPAPLSVAWPTGVTATLTARALTGSIFVEWPAGRCAGTDPDQRRMLSCTLSVSTSQVSITARVVLARRLSVNLLGGGAASPQVMVGVDQPQFPDSVADFTETVGTSDIWPGLAEGSIITLTAVPNNAHFVGWSGDEAVLDGCVPSSLTCTFPLSADLQAVASFASPVTLSLTVSERTGQSRGAVRVDSTPPRTSGLPVLYGVGSSHGVSLPLSARVALSAELGLNNLFIGWGAGSASPQTPCAGLPATQRVCEYDVAVAHQVTATFSAPRVVTLVIAGAVGAGEIEVAGPLQREEDPLSGQDQSEGIGRYSKTLLSRQTFTFWTLPTASGLAFTARPVNGAVFLGWELSTPLAASAIDTNGDSLSCITDSAAECQLLFSSVDDPTHVLTATFQFIHEVDLGIDRVGTAQGPAVEIAADFINGAAQSLSLSSAPVSVAASTVFRVVGASDVVLTADAGSDSFFDGWTRGDGDGAASGSCAPSDPVSVCSYPGLAGDIALRASFLALAQVNVQVDGAPTDSVTLSGPGSFTGMVMGGSTATFRVPADATLRFERSADTPTSQFLGWGGDCIGSGRGSTCFVLARPDVTATVTARFATLRTVRLLMTAGGLLDVSGAHRRQYVGPLDQTFEVADSELLVFTVAPSPGGASFSWDGRCAASVSTPLVTVTPDLSPVLDMADGSACAMTVSEDLLSSSGTLQVGVAFGTSNVLTLSAENSGALLADVATPLFRNIFASTRLLSTFAKAVTTSVNLLSGMSVALTAEPGAGSDAPPPPELEDRLFREWQGAFCDGSSVTECTFEMPSTTTRVTAQFLESIIFPITLSGPQYTEGTLTWSIYEDDPVMPLVTRQIALPNEQLQSASTLVYALQDFNFGLSVAASGSVEWSPAPLAGITTGGITVLDNSDCSGSATTNCVMLLTSTATGNLRDRPLSVVLLPADFTLTVVTPNNAGVIISLDSGATEAVSQDTQMRFTMPFGTLVSISSSPNTGLRFDAWSGGLCRSDAPLCSFVAPSASPMGQVGLSVTAIDANRILVEAVGCNEGVASITVSAGSVSGTEGIACGMRVLPSAMFGQVEADPSAGSPADNNIPVHFQTWHWSDGLNHCVGALTNRLCAVATSDTVSIDELLVVTAVYSGATAPTYLGDDIGLSLGRQGAGSLLAYHQPAPVTHTSASGPSTIRTPFSELDIQLIAELPVEPFGSTVHVSVTPGELVLFADPSTGVGDFHDMFDIASRFSHFSHWIWPGTACDNRSTNPCSVVLAEGATATTATAVFVDEADVAERFGALRTVRLRVSEGGSVNVAATVSSTGGAYESGRPYAGPSNQTIELPDDASMTLSVAVPGNESHFFWEGQCAAENLGEIMPVASGTPSCELSISEDLLSPASGEIQIGAVFGSTRQLTLGAGPGGEASARITAPLFGGLIAEIMTGLAVAGGVSATTDITVPTKSRIALTATPAAGYTFAGWTLSGVLDGVSCPETECILPAGAATAGATATASYSPRPLMVNIASSTGGLVSVALNSALSTVAAGEFTTLTVTVLDALTLAASSTAGYTFAGWTLSGASCAAGTIENICVISTVGIDTTATAEFRRIQHTFTVVSGDNGEVEVMLNSTLVGTVAAGESTELTVTALDELRLAANPGDGYDFAGWESRAVACGFGPTAETCVINAGSIVADARVSASYSAGTGRYQLALKVVGPGSVSVMVGPTPLGTFDGGDSLGVPVSAPGNMSPETIVLTAITPAGVSFNGWTLSFSAGSCAEAQPSSTCTILPGGTILRLAATATFIDARITLTVTAGAGGSVSAAVGSTPLGTAAAGASTAFDAPVADALTLTASSTAGYTFAGWRLSEGLSCAEGALSLSAAACTLASGSVSVDGFAEAEFRIVMRAFALTVVAGAGGSVDVMIGSTPAVTVAAGTPMFFPVAMADAVTLTARLATPGAGYEFTGWTLSDGLSCNEGSTSLTCTLAAGSVGAGGAAAAEFRAVAGGTSWIGPGEVSVSSDGSMATAVPYADGAFVRWTAGPCAGSTEPACDISAATGTTIAEFLPFVADGAKALAFGLGYNIDPPPAYYQVLLEPSLNSGFTAVDGLEMVDPANQPNAALARLELPSLLLSWDGSYMTQACDASDSCIAAVGGQAVAREQLARAVGQLAPASSAPMGFAAAVALSGDGTTLAAGNPADSNGDFTGVLNSGHMDFGTMLAASAPMTPLDGSGAAYIYSGLPAGPLAAVAYIRAPNPDAEDRFGAAVALSADGSTLAVGAPGEGGAGRPGQPSAGSDAFVPDPADMAYIDALADDTAAAAGAVYVYRRAAMAGTWSLEAYVKAPNAEASDEFGASVALSSTGSMLAVGAPGEDGAARRTGNFTHNASCTVDGNVFSCYQLRERSAVYDTALNDNGATDSGAAYIYRRAEGGTSWSIHGYIKAHFRRTSQSQNGLLSPGAGDRFGAAVALSGDGLALAVGAPHEDGDSGGPQSPNTFVGNLGNNGAPEAGAVWIFTRSSTLWETEAYVKSPASDSDDLFGSAVALSADGVSAGNLALAVGAVGEGSSATGVFHPGDGAGYANAIADSDAADSGAAYIYRRTPGAPAEPGSWTTEAYVKAPNADAGDAFGSAVALSASGTTLVAGATSENGSVEGVFTDTDAGYAAALSDNTSAGTGAAYVYRLTDSVWSVHAYVKAPDPLANGGFGSVVALSADGDALAVSRNHDDVSGVDGRLYLY